MTKVSESDLFIRLEQFRKFLTEIDDTWEAGFIFGKINIFYFTGTMQNGVLFIPREGEPVFYVRKSFERACEESPLENIKSIKSFRDITDDIGSKIETIHIEKDVVPIGFIERFSKYFNIKNFKSLDLAVLKSRAIKTEFELELMKKSGEIHREIMDNVIPTLLTEGISEAELGGKILEASIRLGSFGITRMGTFNAELFLGDICFGESGNYYTPFDGPVGVVGAGPAMPVFGSFRRKLKKDTVVLADTGCNYEGYHTDKTAVYAFGEIPQEAYDIHKKCVEIQNMIAEELKPGNIPSEIYKKITSRIDEDFDINFMGFGPNKVKFLGHGIGLVIDEYPVIANGFNEPLVKNMTLAVEPKKGIEKIGMVGIENTFVVTEKGGVSITGDNFDIIKV
jgi:Xaa-Pro aminopeptidase